MKKAAIAFLLISAAFACVMIGTFIGRNTSDNFYKFQVNPDFTADASFAQTDSLGKLDLNEATLWQLSELPNIGPVLAQRILDYRTDNGPFQSVDDLMLVDGIGEKRLEGILPFITVGG